MLRYLYEKPKAVTVTLGVNLVLLTGFLDYLTGPELSLAVFYLLPILLVTEIVGVSACLSCLFFSRMPFEGSGYPQGKTTSRMSQTGTAFSSWRTEK